MFDRVELNRPLANLFKVNDKNNSGVVRLNQVMFKLLIVNRFLRLNCLQTEKLVANCYIVF